MSESNTFSGWAIVEVMGHQRYAGLVGEAVIGGASFVRVDVPEVVIRGQTRSAFTKLLGAGAIFAITPVSEEVAREAAMRFYTPPPVEFDVPRIAHQRTLDEDDEDDAEGDDLGW